MNNFNGMYNPYPWLNQKDFTQQPQIMQNLSNTISTQVQCYYVNNPKDMEKIQVSLNVLYIGVNPDRKEIYLRQMNNNGLIDFNTYYLKSGEQEKSDMTKIMERIDKLENNVLKGAKNVSNYTANGSNRNANANGGQIQERPTTSNV